MEETTQSIQDLEKEAEFVTKVFNNFFNILKKEVNLSMSEKQNIFKEVNQHYKKHRDTYKNICYVKGCDIFKIISWAAMFIYQKKQEKYILKVACLYMNQQLKKCNREVSNQLIDKIIKCCLMIARKIMLLLVKMVYIRLFVSLMK